eukprot:3941092-Rhodomonas_salina.1
MSGTDAAYLVQSLRDSARTTPFPASPTHSNIARYLPAYTPKSNTRNRIPGTKCTEIAYRAADRARMAVPCSFPSVHTAVAIAYYYCYILR